MMAKDTLFQSFENLLNYVDSDHMADHEDGHCVGPKSECVTCLWLVDAEKNYNLLKELVKE